MNDFPCRATKAEKFTLLLLIALQFWIFGGSFDKYFNLDSLFYIIEHPSSPADYARLFTRPDAAAQYRPLTLAVMGLVVPLLGTDPWPYHWIPLLFHALNTFLFYLLARRLLSDSLSVLAAVAFWGFHSVAGWITYDITYLSDFMMAAFSLAALILALDGWEGRSKLRIAASLVFCTAALLTKEAAVMLPAAVLFCLMLTRLRSAGEGLSLPAVWTALKKAALPAAAYFVLAALLAALLASWLSAGALYSQGTAAAYDINPLSNLADKLRYFYWALNLPDELHIGRGPRNRLLAFGLMGALLGLWLLDVLKRRRRLTPVEWAGLAWLAAMSVPALMLSQRTAKWYLYVPAMGLALTIGSLAGRLRDRLPRLHGWERPMILSLFLVPMLFSASVQTRSRLAHSDDAYQSEVLQSCLKDFKTAYPELPAEATFFFLPSHDVNVLRLLSSGQISDGQLFELYYPGTDVKMLFAHRGDTLPEDYADRPDVRIVTYLDRRLYDVTPYYRAHDRLTLHLLPTRERVTPPLMEKEPIGGWDLHARHIELLIADRGDRLPEDMLQRGELWVLQYIMGHFYDVTGFLREKASADTLFHSAEDLDSVDAAVSRGEFYPDYENFGTPNGRPIFFLTPETDIVTQIGGSTAAVPLGQLPERAELRFDIAFMHDMGDGAWAEVALRCGPQEESLYRRYMEPNPKGKGMTWQRVNLGLDSCAGREAVLLLKCLNSPGNTTIADWLNWRGLSIRTP